MGSKKEWFGEWFNSKYYHILYKHRDHEEASLFIDNLCQHLQLKPGQKVLDLACGKGRHAIYLSKKGFDVIGLDLSEQNIASAKKKESPALKFYNHDMRQPWGKDEFDCTFNLFTSFGYFEDDTENQLAINNVARSLKKGGRFILDFLNPYTVINHLVGEEIKVIDGLEFHIIKEFTDGFIIKKITFTDREKSYYYQEKVKAIRRVHFLVYFENAGLSLVDLFGNYELKPYEAEKSERMIFYLKK